jgi:hypothetical protein
MKRAFSRRPSGSMLVAMTALLVALSGTALAAGTLTSGDNLIKKGSLSGNRLRGHTLSGKQINLSKLGKVPSAAKADTATTATSATSATTATTALTLQGAAPSAFQGRLYAKLDSSCSLLAGAGVSSANQSGTGRCRVFFDRDVDGCGLVATVNNIAPGDPGAGSSTVMAGESSAANPAGGQAVFLRTGSGGAADVALPVTVEALC